MFSGRSSKVFRTFLKQRDMFCREVSSDFVRGTTLVHSSDKICRFRMFMIRIFRRADEMFLHIKVSSFKCKGELWYRFRERIKRRMVSDSDVFCVSGGPGK